MEKSEIYIKVLSAVAEVYEVAGSEIEHKSRNHQVCNARHMLHLVLQNHCGFSTQDLLEHAHTRNTYGRICMQQRIKKDPYAAMNYRMIVNILNESMS